MSDIPIVGWVEGGVAPPKKGDIVDLWEAPTNFPDMMPYSLIKIMYKVVPQGWSPVIHYTSIMNLQGLGYTDENQNRPLRRRLDHKLS